MSLISLSFSDPSGRAPVMGPLPLRCFIFFMSFIGTALGQASSCSETLTPTKSVRPSIASGYRMTLVATGLTKPRSIQFDTAGNLLVVQSGTGIVNLALQDDGGVCLSVKSQKTVVTSSEVGMSCRKAIYTLIIFLS